MIAGKKERGNYMEKKLKILVFTNGTTSPRWRFEGQMKRINEQTNHEMFVTLHNNWNGDIVGANLVVLEMLTGENIVRECQAQGAKVIYDADDAVIDSYGKERKNLQHIGPAWAASSKKTVAACDAVTVSNQVLKENYGRFTKKPIYIDEFSVDFNWYGRDKLRIQRTTDEIRLGWFGSKGHYEDLKMVTPVIKEILKKYPKVKFVYGAFGGMSSERLLTEVGWGEDIFKSIPRDRREFVIGVPGDFWPMKHRLLDFDIGISPLIDDYFNSCKTYTKWLEYSALGTPGVYSPTVYNRVVKHGKTGFIAKNKKEWVDYLSQLIENKTLRKQMGKAARRTILKKYDMDKQWENLLDIYKEVLNGRN